MSNMLHLGTERVRIVLLVGRGSRVPAVLQCVKHIKNARVVFVLSCYGEDIGTATARRNKIKTGILVWQDYKNLQNGRRDFSARVRNLLKSYQTDLVVMAGWRVLMPKTFVEEFRGRIINIHPSILPSFPGDGDKAIKAQWEARFDKDASPSGCTLHYVDEGMDTGVAILKAVVYPRGYRTLEEFAEAIHKKEDEILCEGIKKLVAKIKSYDKS